MNSEEEFSEVEFIETVYKVDAVLSYWHGCAYFDVLLLIYLLTIIISYSETSPGNIERIN